MSSQATDLYEKHGINVSYDYQRTYGPGNSHYGNGKYPPDWNARREAVWERQQYQCGRCGTYKGDAVASEVHHIVHLEQGGSNSLENLVGLCVDCHALMHPDVEALRGTVGKSEVFPSDHADDRVAVVRKPHRNEDFRIDVQRLSEISTPDQNENAITDEVVPTSSVTARRASESLDELLLEHDFVPRTTAYHRVSVRPRPVDLLAAVTKEGVDLTARGDGEALEVEVVSDDQIDVYFSADTSMSELELQDPAGETTIDELRFETNDGARLRVEKPITAPPLTAANVPQYTVGVLRYFGWESLKIGAIPGLVLALLVPSLAPTGYSITGILVLALLLGLLLRSPRIYQDATGSASERVVDERKHST